MAPIEPFKSGEPIIFRHAIKGRYGWPGHEVPGRFVAGDVERNRRVLVRVLDASGIDHAIWVKGSNVSRPGDDLKLAKADIREAEREIVRLTAALERESAALCGAVVRAEQTHAALVALVGFWRARAVGIDDRYQSKPFIAATYEECARELEAALAQPVAKQP